jgi:hypothetical protein
MEIDNMSPTIIWLSVMTMTSDLGDFEPIITPFQEEDVCNEKTQEAAEVFGRQMQSAQAEWEIQWSCEFFQMPPAQYGF